MRNLVEIFIFAEGDCQGYSVSQDLEVKVIRKEGVGRIVAAFVMLVWCGEGTERHLNVLPA